MLRAFRSCRRPASSNILGKNTGASVACRLDASSITLGIQTLRIYPTKPNIKAQEIA